MNAFRCDIGLCSYVVILDTSLASVSRVKNELSLKVLKIIITLNCQFHNNWVAPSAEEDHGDLLSASAGSRVDD